MRPSNIKLQDLLDISESDDKADFERRLVDFAQRLDFGIVAAAVAVERPGRSALFEMIGNTPAGFLDASRSPDAADRDPVMRRLKTTSIPFVYDQALYVRDGAGDLWEEQAPWGYRTGVIVFFLQIDTVVLKKSNRDKHLQNWLSSTPRAFGAD